ncbi:MAG: glycosyltransferase family 2 protein, partial [Acidimicrobiales bacterium]
ARDSSVILRHGLAAPRSPDVAGRPLHIFPGSGCGTSPPKYSGAFGLFRRDLLREIGGYQADSIGEDMELVVRLRRNGIERGEPSRVVFVPEPGAWTEAPESLRVLGRQRDQ